LRNRRSFANLRAGQVEVDLAEPRVRIRYGAARIYRGVALQSHDCPAFRRQAIENDIAARDRNGHTEPAGQKRGENGHRANHHWLPFFAAAFRLSSASGWAA